jgi:hypothetical protein
MNSFQRFLLGLLVVAGFCVAVARARAADTMQFERSFVLDKRGDGQVTDMVHFPAKRWAVWKQQYGDRPDMLWRDKKQQLASMALVDFDLKKNEIERTATMKISFRGGPRLRSDGASEIGVPKDMKKISDSGREWIFSAVAQDNSYDPTIVNETIRVTLPAEARNARLDQPGTAFQALVYEIPGAGRGKGMLYVGIGALLIGLVLGVAGFLPGKSSAA